MGYADDGKIGTLYELSFNEALPTYLYAMQYTSPDVINASLTLDSSTGTGRISFGGNSSYKPNGTYKYENSKLIFTTSDSFELKLVFLDVGGTLIYSEKDSDTKGFEELFPNGASFNLYYPLYYAQSATKAFDIDGDGAAEIIFANVSLKGALYYIIHRFKTIQEKTIPFEAYDLISWEVSKDALYLVCEYRERDFNSYRYKVSFDGENLIFTPED